MLVSTKFDPDFTSPSDSSLIERLRAGDRVAMGLIFARHQETVFRFAVAFVGNRDMAHDVTQETFLQLVLKPEGFNAERGALAAFLCGIARNCARAALRQTNSNRNQELPEDDLLSDGESTEPGSSTWINVPLQDSALSELSRSENERLLWSAIRKLPEHYREVLILVELQDFSYAQAASLLAVEIGTVRSRLSRAKERLTAILNRNVANPISPCSNELSS